MLSLEHILYLKNTLKTRTFPTGLSKIRKNQSIENTGVAFVKGANERNKSFEKK